jgi:hypothetical protein
MDWQPPKAASFLSELRPNRLIFEVAGKPR